MKQNGVDREAVVRTLKEALRRIEMCKSIESPSEEMSKMLSMLEQYVNSSLPEIGTYFMLLATSRKIWALSKTL